MRRVAIKVLQDSVIGTHTFVEGDEVQDVPFKFAEKLVKAGKAVLTEARVMDMNEVVKTAENLNVFNDPETNELGIPFEDQAKNDASPHPVNLETAVVPRPNKTNGKPKPPVKTDSDKGDGEKTPIPPKVD